MYVQCGGDKTGETQVKEGPLGLGLPAPSDLPPSQGPGCEGFGRTAGETTPTTPLPQVSRNVKTPSRPGWARFVTTHALVDDDATQQRQPVATLARSTLARSTRTLATTHISSSSSTKSVFITHSRHHSRQGWRRQDARRARTLHLSGIPKQTSPVPIHARRRVARICASDAATHPPSNHTHRRRP